MAVPVVHLLEVVDVDQDQREVRSVTARAVELLLEALVEDAPVGEPGQGILLRLVRELSEHSRKRATETRRQAGGEREREDRRDEEPAPVRHSLGFDGRDGLDGEHTRAGDSEWSDLDVERRRAEDDPAVLHEHGVPDRSSCDDASASHEHECRVRRQRGRVADQHEQRLAQRHGECDACDHLRALRDGRGRRDPGRRSELAGRLAPGVDPRVVADGDTTNRGAVVCDDRALKVQ